MSPQEMEEHRRKKREAKAEREKFAKTMGLEYWLEMVGSITVLSQRNADLVRWISSTDTAAV